jgi:beta-hydroxylase
MNAMDQPAPPPRPALSDRLFRIGKKLRHRVSAVVAKSSKVGDTTLYDPAIFPWIASIERQWPEIRAELQAVLNHEAAIPPLADISPDHRRIAPPGKWKSFFLHGYGYRLEENLRRCPVTAAAVAAVPGLNSAFFFHPGARRAYSAPPWGDEGDPHRASRLGRAALGAAVPDAGGG